MRRILCCAGIALSLLFNGCKKQETVQSADKPTVVEKFFSTSEVTKEPVKRIASVLQRNSEKNNYIEELIKNEGFAYWDNSTISVSENDTVILVPLVQEEEQYVASFIFAKLNRSISMRVISGGEYATYGFGHNEDSISASYIASKLMYFDNSIFGDTLFEVTDRTIFGAGEKDSGYYHLRVLKQDRSVQALYAYTTMACYNVTYGNGNLTGVAPGGTADYYYDQTYSSSTTTYVDLPDAYAYPAYTRPPSRSSIGASTGSKPPVKPVVLCRDANGKAIMCNPLELAPNEVDNLLKELFNVTPKEIDPNKWYFYSSVFGWTETKLPTNSIFNESIQNDAGYYSGRQVLQFLQKASEDKRRKEREEQLNEAYQAAYEWAKASNLFGLLYELSPVKAIYDGGIAFGNGQYVAGTILVSTGAVDIGPLFRTFGKGYVTVARGLAEHFTVTELWALESRWNLVRGSLLEVKQSVKYIAKGFEWLAEVTPFYKAIDFYNAATKTAVSLKTVNATANFEFKNILKNIEQLKNLKHAGKSVYAGVERQITAVELHIATPPGYNRIVNGQDVFKNVLDAAGTEVKVVFVTI